MYNNLWNVTQNSYALTGVQGSTATGSPTVNISVNPTITAAGLTVSTNTPGTSVFVTGVSSTSSIGTFSISGDSQLTIVAASEPEMDALVGTVAIEIGKTAFPTGNAITTSLGTEVITGNAIVSPTGVGLTSTLGTEGVEIDVNVVGVGGLVTKTVTVVATSGGNKYFIDGVQQDTLELLEGNTYVFTYPSGHPFKFSTTSDGSHGGGSEYTTGVTHNSSTQVTIVVATNAPTLY